MKFTDKILNFFKDLDEKKFIRYSAIALGIIFLLVGIIVYKHFSTISSLKKELRRINILRQEAQLILSKNVQVKKQKSTVNEIIEKGKNFKLRQYFDSVVEQVGISKNIKDNPEVTTNDLENLTAQGYTEVRLSTNFSGINMKQLVELLDTFEKNERIYTKSLDITKSENVPAIDVNIVIATIQPKTEITESTE